MPNETITVFSSEWGRRIAAAINASDGYRRAAASWCDTLGLVMTDGPAGPPRAAVLDLRNGGCHGVETGNGAPTADAAFLLSAGRDDWRELLAGDLEPMWGIMSGRLRLEQGSLANLLPFAQAAKLLVEAIATVDAEFPGESDPSADPSADPFGQRREASDER